MLKMFESKKSPSTKAIKTEVTYSEAAGRELKIGKLAKILIPKLLQNGKVSEDEIQQMFTAGYSKTVLGLQYPALVKAGDKFDKTRYYALPFKVGSEEYFLCSQWFETTSNNDRPFLEKWISEHE